MSKRKSDLRETTFQIRFSARERKQLARLADARNVSEAQIVREAVAAKFRMEIDGLPTCASGMQCLVPHMHVQTRAA